MMARTCIFRSWKSLLAIMAVFLLLLALPCGTAHAAETISAAGLVTASAVEANGGEVTDGASFVGALGNQAKYAVEDGVCIVTLTGDVKLTNVALLKAGSYKLVGKGTISRADEYMGLLLKLEQGVSLEISGSVVLDGGAVWTKDGASVNSAVGATNEGVVATASLVDNIRGTLVISENAVLRNNDSFAAVYAEWGTTIMNGGSIYANRATSNYGGGIHAYYYGSVEMSGGEIWGNVAGPNALASAIYGYSSAEVNISNGSVHDNGGPVAVAATPLTVSGGTFSNNLGAALGRSSSASVSGGTFSNNEDGAFANSLNNSAALLLSGSPVFVTDDDAVITAMVKLVGDLDLGDDVTVRLAVNEYRMGNQVLFGTPELLEANHSHFKMAGEDKDLVVNAAGRIDTDPSSFVHEGADLVRLFGGEEVATSLYDEETRVYTVTLKRDVALPRMTYIESGSYVLTGTGTITRSGNYPGALLKTITGTSLEITGSVVLDGGAAWTKDGVPTESAVGATNTGVVSNMALVDNYGGALKISGGAILRNNSNNCAVYCDNGTLEITGGKIYGISSTDGGGAVRVVSNSNVTIKGGEFWGNAVTSNGRGSGVDGENSTVKIEGGTFRDSSGPAVVAARNLEVVGGTFKDNEGAALGTRSSNSVALSGGTFEGNAGGAFACTYGTSALKLSGSPSFATDADATVHSTVELVGELGENVSVKIQPNSFALGDTVITGSEDLLATYIGQFTLVSDGGEYVINDSGRVDTETTSLITNGDDFAAALGGVGFAESSYDSESGVYTITLRGNVVLSHRLLIESGSYVLAGAGMISRADNYRDVLLKTVTNTSLEITGSVVIDGGAAWTKDGVPTESAVGARNTGIASNMALVDNYGGALKISGDAILRNNSNNCAVYCDAGTLEITGGKIYGICSNDGGGAVRVVKNSSVEITGGEIWGNAVVFNGRGSVIDGENSTVMVKGGLFKENSGPAAVVARNLEVTGGEFKNNAGAALGTRSSNSVALSGGTFEGNAGGAFACTYGTSALKLSGSPSFATDADATVHSTVELVGELGDRVMMRIHLDNYNAGQKVLAGEESLVATYHSCFSLVGADGEYVVSATGEIDANPAESISDGEAFEAALGGEDFAESSYDSESEVYTIALKKDVALSNAIEVTSGSYVLEGQGVISRASGYTAALFQVTQGSSLEISGNVALDGGAVWKKDGQRVETAVGATNEGAKSIMALVNSYGGSFVLSGNAALRNNDGNPALYSNGGSLAISGGSIYGIHRSGYGAAVDFSNVAFEMTSGTISGNVGEGLGSIIRGGTTNSTARIAGGIVSDNEGPVAVVASDVSVSDGEFSGNSGAVIGVHGSGSALVSGGVFSNNPGGVFASEEESVSLQLSGAPSFATDNDKTVHATVELAGALGDNVTVRIQLGNYLVGDQVLFGGEELVEAYYKRFTLVSEGDEFVVDSAGRVDTDPTSFVNNGDAFAAALGGQGVATSAYDKATGTYTITLSRDVALTHAIVLESGSYVLTGSGTISRGDSYTNALLKFGAGSSLKVAGDVVFDGGAVWMKGGERVESAMEADDWKGVEASWAMIENTGGDFTLSGNAVLRNCYSLPALYSLGGTVTIEGGSIYGNDSDYGAVSFSDAALVMTGGEIWGNLGDGILCGYNPDSPNVPFSGSIAISGGSLHDNGCWAVALADEVSVAGGTFSSNEEFAVGGRSVAISGGTFSGNYGAVYAEGDSGPGIIQLSGAPVFDGEYDIVIGQIEVVGELTGSDVCVYPYSEEGEAVIRGAGSYVLTESDVAKFSLPGFDVPPGFYLDFDSESNQIVLAKADPVLLEVTAVGDIEFDGAAIDPGVDFNVKVFKYVDGKKGDEITANYAFGGGSAPVTYRYRIAGSTAYTMGLPSKPGTYDVQAIVSADKANGFASSTVQFTLTITGDIPPSNLNPAPEVSKLANTLEVTAKKAVKIKARKLKKKSRKIARKKAIIVNKARGEVTYKLVGVKKAKFKKYFKVAKKTGDIKVKKRLKRGTYRLKIAVTAAGDASFEPVTKVVTVKVKVK